jgi:hypothetical protein
VGETRGRIWVKNGASTHAGEIPSVAHALQLDPETRGELPEHLILRLALIVIVRGIGSHLRGKVSCREALSASNAGQQVLHSTKRGLEKWPFFHPTKSQPIYANVDVLMTQIVGHLSCQVVCCSLAALFDVSDTPVR